MATDQPYKTALRWPVLTRFYDGFIAVTMREKTFRRAIVEQLRHAAPDGILDVGCGTGTLALLLRREFPQAAVVGVDGDEEVLRIARRKAEGFADAPVIFKKAWATSLPFQDGSWHAATSSLVLHHLPDGDKLLALREMRRVLQPGGVLVVADFGKPSGILTGMLFSVAQFFDGFDTTAANRRGDIPRMMAQSGFTQVRTIRRIDTAFGTLDILQAFTPS